MINGANSFWKLPSGLSTQRAVLQDLSLIKNSLEGEIRFQGSWMLRGSSIVCIQFSDSCVSVFRAGVAPNNLRRDSSISILSTKKLYQKITRVKKRSRLFTIPVQLSIPLKVGELSKGLQRVVVTQAFSSQQHKRRELKKLELAKLRATYWVIKKRTSKEGCKKNT